MSPAEIKKKGASPLVKSIIYSYKWSLVSTVLYSFLLTLINYGNSGLLYMILKAMKEHPDQEIDYAEVFLLLGIYLLSNFIQSLFNSQIKFQQNLIG